MRLLVGGFIAGAILYLAPGPHGAAPCVAAGILAALLMLQLGPRSIVEKIGAGMTAALIAWVARPPAAPAASLVWHLAGWLLASAALAAYLSPRTE